ncbi:MULTISPECIES: hypothetical protein [Lysobacteraceae]|uniref:hypothetical protein n=1 Tax=Lysobacteraceae TaxID=32033 RepID=UPI0011A4FA68|nr:hypothetical protein [Lysobacter ruishenii]
MQTLWVAGRFVLSRGRFVSVMMRMPMIGLQGHGVLQVMEIAHGTQHRLHQYAQRHQRQQGDAQKAAVAANAVHGTY